MPPASATTTVTAISPSSGTVGTLVTITGAGISSSSLGATVSGESVPVTVLSPSSATLVVPNDAPTGSDTITVTSGGSTLASFGFVVFGFSASPPDAEVGANYTARLTVTGGKAPYTWTVTGGTLPLGVTFSSNGTFSGAPKVAGGSTVTVQATDANGASAQNTVTVNVDPGPTVSTVALAPATIGTAYLATLGVVGGTAPYSWSIASGGIPGGLVLSSTGVLSGRPGALGTSTINVRVSDALGSQGTKSLTVVVRTVPQSLTLVTASGAAESVSTYLSPTVTILPVADPVAVASSANGAETWVTTAQGTVFGLFGTASLGGIVRPTRHPIVAIAARPDGTGYWLVTSAGHVFGFGASKSRGSITGRRSGVVVGIASTPNGRGYVIVTSTGHLYRFGNAPRVAPVSLRRLHGRPVGVVVTTDGHGLFVASSSGTVVALGSARTERIHTPAVSGAVRAIVANPSGEGYWLITATGAIAAAGAAGPLPVLAVPPGVVVAASP